jgi:hypothetical protein
MFSRRFLPLFLLVIAITAVAAPACEMCRDAVITNGGGGGIDGTASSAGLDFNASVLYMLGSVFAVAGWIGWVMYKAVQGQQSHAERGPRGFPIKSNVG